MVKFREMISKHVGEKYAKEFKLNEVTMAKEIKKMVNQNKNIVFLGATGSGKTMDLIYIAYLKYLEHNNKKLTYENGDEYHPEYKLAWYHSNVLTRIIVNDGKIFNNAYDNTLFIDDFGIFPYRSFDKEYFYSQLDYLFEKLIGSNVTCYISTNFTKDKLGGAQYTRIISRLRQNGYLFNTGREDRRSNEDSGEQPYREPSSIDAFKKNKGENND